MAGADPEYFPIILAIGSKPAPFAGGPNDGSRRAGGTFTVIVTGASNNNYFSIGGLVPGQSVQIDKWR